MFAEGIGSAGMGRVIEGEGRGQMTNGIVDDPLDGHQDF